VVYKKYGNIKSWRYAPSILLCVNCSRHGLIAGDGDVHIIDRDENVWPLRILIAKNLAWLLNVDFSTERMTYTHELSKDDANCIFEVVTQCCFFKMNFSCATKPTRHILNISLHNSRLGTLTNQDSRSTMVGAVRDKRKISTADIFHFKMSQLRCAVALISPAITLEILVRS
jgi:hypothetical protein